MPLQEAFSQRDCSHDMKKGRPGLPKRPLYSTGKALWRSYMTPCSIMLSATLRKPAMLPPMT